MVWVLKRRWWLLTAGVVLVLLSIAPPGQVTDLRGVAGTVGFVMMFLAMLAVLLSIPMALRARHEARRSSNSHWPISR